MDYIRDEIGLDNETRRCLKDALIFGQGIMKMGFDSEYGMDAAEVVDRIEASVRISDVGQAVQALRTIAGLGPSKIPPKTKPFGGAKIEPLEYKTNVIKEYPWALRVSPWDFLVDPQAMTLNEARWCAFRIIRPVEDIQADKRYRAIREKIKGENFGFGVDTVFDDNGEPGEPSRLTGPSGISAGEGAVIQSITRKPPLAADATAEIEPEGVLYEIWDRKTDMVYTISTELTEFLREEPNPLEIEGLPVKMLAFNDVPDRFWPKGDLADIETQILELNQIRQLNLQWLRRMAKWVIAAPEGTLSEEQKKKLLSGDPFIFLEIEGQNVEAIKPLDLGNFHPDVYNIEQLLKRDIKDIYGFSEEELGAAVPGVTATASANVAQASSIRMQERQRKFEEFYRDVARTLFQITRQFFPPEVQIRIVGEGDAEMLTVTADDIRKEMDLRIEAGSSTKPNDEVKRRQFTEFLQVLTQVSAGVNPATGGPNLLVNWEELMKPIAYAYGIENPQKIFQTPPPLPMGGPLGADNGTLGGGGASSGNELEGGPEAGNGAASMQGRFSQAISNRIGQQRVMT